MGIEKASGRVVAGLIAVTIWIGLAVQFHAVMEQTGSVSEAIWVLLRYFTIITNLLAALVLTGIAFGKPSLNSPSLLGGIGLSIGFVGVIYVLFLRGLLELSGGASLANFLLHYASPILSLLYWLIFAPKGGLNYSNPVLWVIYPLAYGVYAILRGAVDGKFAYPFIDVPLIGWPQTAANILLMALTFLAAGFALVWLDSALGRRSQQLQC